MRAIIGSAVGLLVALSGPVVASAQVFHCPEPYHTVESLTALLQRMAWEGAPNIGGLVSRALSPGGPPSCPALSEGIDLAEAADALVRFVAAENDPALNLEFYEGLIVAVRRSQRVGGRPILPLDALSDAVENTTSGSVVYTLGRLADLPQVRSYLLRMMRAERGPPSRPDLPEGLARFFSRWQSQVDEELRREFSRAPEQVRNPRARCWAEVMAGRRESRECEGEGGGR